MEGVREKMASRAHDLKLYLEWADPELKALVSALRFVRSHVPDSASI